MFKFKVFKVFKNINNNQGAENSYTNNQNNSGGQQSKFVEIGNNALKKFKFSIAIIFILAVAISYYIILPPINIKSMEFCAYLMTILIALTIIFFIDSFSNPKSKVIYKISSGIAIAMVIIIALSNLYSSPLFQAKRYAAMIKKETSKFEEDIKQADFSKLPVVDRDTAIRLGARKMGEMGALVSQYNIDEKYSQITINSKPVRVTPLVYADVIKWFLNKDKGIPYYIKIDMVSQNASLIKLQKSIKYSMSDKFSRNLYRHIRFSYPTSIIYEINFETDEKEHPYFIASVVEPTIGLFGGLDAKGVIVVDAITGKMKKYDVKDVPDWVDRVYPADLVEKQLNYNGGYERGFINSKIKQEGVTRTTQGYNYIAMGNDIYLYTGITSVLSDESNIGFVFVNMRTKETKFYPVSSAEELSVMQSAAGTVQEKGYKATFPILINMYNRPTYFMALKDAAGLTKMYALVDAQSYQKVAVGESLSQTISNYKRIISDIAVDSTIKSEKEIHIAQIKNVVLDGKTMYYIKADGENTIYSASIDISPQLAFLKEGDVLKITGNTSEGVFIITSIGDDKK